MGHALAEDLSASEPYPEPNLAVRDFQFNPDSGFVTLSWNSVEGRIYAIEELSNQRAAWLKATGNILGQTAETVWSFAPRFSHPSHTATLFRVREIKKQSTDDLEESEELEQRDSRIPEKPASRPVKEVSGSQVSGLSDKLKLRKETHASNPPAKNRNFPPPHQ